MHAFKFKNILILQIYFQNKIKSRRFKRLVAQKQQHSFCCIQKKLLTSIVKRSDISFFADYIVLLHLK